MQNHCEFLTQEEMKQEKSCLTVGQTTLENIGENDTGILYKVSQYRRSIGTTEDYRAKTKEAMQKQGFPEEVIETLNNTVVSIRSKTTVSGVLRVTSGGTGTFITPNVILTAGHVIANLDLFDINRLNGDAYRPQYLYLDKVADVGFIITEQEIQEQMEFISIHTVPNNNDSSALFLGYPKEGDIRIKGGSTEKPYGITGYIGGIQEIIHHDTLFLQMPVVGGDSGSIV